jgi:hypothetical protein
VSLPKEITDFLSALLSASLAFEAVLLGVFGILYSIYAMYSAAATPENPVRAPICGVLKWICRAIGVLMLIDAVPTLYPLYVLSPSGGVYLAMAWILAGSILLMVSLTLVVAFALMR